MRKPWNACVALFGLMLSCGCVDRGAASSGSALGISMTLSPPPGGTSDVVWVAQGGGSGDVLIVDVMARDITQDFDSFNVEIEFDPLLLEARHYASLGVLETCAGGLGVLACDNVSACGSSANTTGTILAGESITGTMPPGCTLSGELPLGRITFRARARGTSSLPFVPFNGDPDNPQGSRFARRVPPMIEVPVLFFDSGASIDVTR